MWRYGNVACVHRDLKWPNVLEMCCKFFHGLLQCRNRDINIAANHAFTRDFSHSRGPRQREHLDWVSDVTGKWSRRVWSDFVKVCWVYLRGRVRLGGLGDVKGNGLSRSDRLVKYKLLSLLSSYPVIRKWQV